MLTGGFFSNYIIAIPVLTWVLNQAVKILLYGRFKQFRSWKDLFKSGGMPSAHTSFMCSLSTAVLLRDGYTSTSFAIVLCLTGIVLYDAMHVRLESGKHASVLNEIFHSRQIVSPTLEKEYPLETSVGHTFPEVCGGVLFGALMGLLLMQLWNFPFLSACCS